MKGSNEPLSLEQQFSLEDVDLIVAASEGVWNNQYSPDRLARLASSSAKEM